MGWQGGYSAALLASMMALLMVFSATASQAQQPRSEAEIQEIIREYLLENPEILLEMQQAYQEKQRQELAKSQTATLQTAKGSLYEAPYQIEFGAKDPAITVIEFFDYNCGFCKRAIDDMERVLKERDDVRFILKEYPVLGNESLEASRVSMALGELMPDVLNRYHTQLLSSDGVKNGEKAFDLAVEMGADPAKLKEAMEDERIVQTMRETYELAEKLGIEGTPSYIVGQQIVFGAVGHEELLQVLEDQIPIQN